MVTCSCIKYGYYLTNNTEHKGSPPLIYRASLQWKCR
nr:MAG TPA: hypothetical protein [Caudoviricetes sp.]